MEELGLCGEAGLDTKDACSSQKDVFCRHFRHQATAWINTHSLGMVSQVRSIL